MVHETLTLLFNISSRLHFEESHVKTVLSLIIQRLSTNIAKFPLFDNVKFIIYTFTIYILLNLYFWGIDTNTV